MVARKKRLGRGLGGLISGGVTPAPAPGEPKKASTSGKQVQGSPVHPATAGEGLSGYAEIPVASIRVSPYQPRREMNEEQIRELAASIQAEGLLQPIVVRPKGRQYELIAGERRWRAFRSLQLKSIPARVLDVSDSSSAALALIENLQREGLNPIEEALGYASLIRDFDLTQEAASERVGKGRATVANALRLLQLERDIQGYLAKGLLTPGHGKALLGLDDPEQRKILAKRIIQSGGSVRAIEQEVRRIKESGGRGTRNSSGTNHSLSNAEATAIQDLERRLASYLNTRVSLRHSAKRGRIIINYAGNDDLERIMERFGM